MKHPMLVKTYCLRSDRAVRAAPPPCGDTLLYRVLRHIPTDSVTAEQAGTAMAPGAEHIGAVLECTFADAGEQARAVDTPAWRAVEAALHASEELLFALDSAANVPIAPRGAARDGGFRRWMLLKRAAPAADAFRDAWFGRHAQLVSRLPGVDGYCQHLVAARFDARLAPVPHEALQVDGIAALCFADEAAMLASYASPARVPLRDDGLALLAGNVTLLVQGERLA